MIGNLGDCVPGHFVAALGREDGYEIGSWITSAGLEGNPVGLTTLTRLWME